jgi:dephospho-CoA kinase
MKQVVGVYLLGGVTLVSEIALPELPRIQRGSATPHPVTIRLGEVSDHLPGAVEIDPDCFATPSHYFLRIHGIGCYLVSNGQEIVVSPETGALPLDVRAYLLGTLFVILCQQRALLPLHASAVSTTNGVAAFLGRSGQGKSSLAAHLAQRGFRVLADDVCLVESTQSELAMVIPTAPWLKLWRNSLENLGRKAEGLERVFSEDDKYRMPLENAREPEPIRKLVFLETDEGAVTQIQEVSAVEAVPLLMDLTHQAYVLQATDQLQENFLRCSRVSSQARAYRLIRPWGMEHLQSTVDALEKLLRR